MQDDDDKIIDPTDEPVTTGDDDVDELVPGADDDHEIPATPTVDESGVEESQFSEPIASPAVTGEEDVFSGDATEGEAADIDEELKKVGLGSDEDGPKPLTSDDIDY